MLLPWLVNLIETHAEQLTDKVIRAVRANPRTAFLHGVSEIELRQRAFDLFRNLGRWLGEKSEAEIAAAYGDLARQRCREGVPLQELIYALILVKHQLWDYIQQNDPPESGATLYERDQLDMMVGRFFDAALFHTVKGYEETWAKDASLRLLAGTPPAGGTMPTTMGIARAVLGELDARRGVLDSDPGLRSVSLAVKLDSSRKVRSVTVHQESETEFR